MTGQIVGTKLETVQKFTTTGMRIPVTFVQVNEPGDLKPGDFVKVTGRSKGKGWAGVVKRWGFKGGPKTHGQSDRQRSPGSIGQTTTPGRVYKGKHMAGRMGGARVTVSGLTVMALEPEKKLLLIKGLLPGNKKGQITMRKMGENKKFTGLLTNETKDNQETKS
jgi:ribosomal protein L3